VLVIIKITTAREIKNFLISHRRSPAGKTFLAVVFSRKFKTAGGLASVVFTENLKFSGASL
jgi:hypothetical protein